MSRSAPSSRRPRILYLSPCWPLGESYGSQLRALHVSRALRSVGDVTLAVIDFSEPESETVRRTTAEFDVLGYGRLVLQKKPSVSVRIRRVFNPRILPADDLVVEERLKSILLANLDRFDLVWIHNLRTADAFAKWDWKGAVLDIDDVPSTYQSTIVRSDRSRGERLRATVRRWAWKRREACLSSRFDALAVCSAADQSTLRASVPVYVIPNGFEKPASVPERRPTHPPRFGFIGRFGYPPNLEGVRWFVQYCWPTIRQAAPGARLRLIGRGTDGALKPIGPDIDGLGWIEDASAEIASWSAMIVPVHTGAGTRVKIAEAFSRKCPVVSTRLGAFGYDIADGREVLLADTPEDFSAACLRLLQEKVLGEAVATRAWERFLKEWTWDAVAPRICAAAEESLQRAVEQKSSDHSGAAQSAKRTPTSNHPTNVEAKWKT